MPAIFHGDTVRLSTFIIDHIEQIIGEWASLASTLLPADEAMNRLTLRKHAREILEALARDIESIPQSGVPDDGGTETVAATHGALRYEAGFDLLQLNAEFRALRASVTRLWLAHNSERDAEALQALQHFNEAVDQALSEALARYAREVERSRNMFLAILGHDLRTPLNAITMTTQYLGLPNVPPHKQAEALARIDRGVNAMMAMIQDLLEFTTTRLGAGVPVVRVPTDLGNVCRSALDDVRAAHPAHRFTLETAGDLSMMADAARMRQVLWNLLNNAVQHGAGEFPITLSARGEADAVTLRVRNRGPAIPADALQVIFNPLVQLSAGEGAHRIARAANLGLGLFIAREIVLAHGGRIHAASSDADGTVFTVELPRESV